MASNHLRADCLYTGISSGPTLGNEYGRILPFYTGHRMTPSKVCVCLSSVGVCARITTWRAGTVACKLLHLVVYDLPQLLLYEGQFVEMQSQLLSRQAAPLATTTVSEHQLQTGRTMHGSYKAKHHTTSSSLLCVCSRAAVSTML